MWASRRSWYLKQDRKLAKGNTRGTKSKGGVLALNPTPYTLNPKLKLLGCRVHLDVGEQALLVLEAGPEACEGKHERHQVQGGVLALNPTRYTLNPKLKRLGFRVHLDVGEQALLVLGHFEEIRLLGHFLEWLSRGRVLVVLECRLCRFRV